MRLVCAALPFWKLQSIGNDFVLIHLDDILALLVPPSQDPTATSSQALSEVGQLPEGNDGGLEPNREAQPSKAGPIVPTISSLELNQYLGGLSIKVCDRKFGIGADGLLTVKKVGTELQMRMFNPDGTEDFCGNGLRCATLHVVNLGWFEGAFMIDHFGRRVRSVVVGGRVTTKIGVADYTPEKVPQTNGELFNQTVWSGMDSGMPLSLFGSALTTGSTHVVIPTTWIPDDDSFRSISSKIEVDPLYPNRTSVIWSEEVEPMKLRIRIWERGVGETLGCGTGSSAAAADYLRRKDRGGTVEVINPGGSIFVTMEAWYRPITVEGVAIEVYQGMYRSMQPLTACAGTT